MDPMADRQITPGEARALFVDAVKANILHNRTQLASSRFSQERDEILADLAAAGYVADIDEYDFAGDVPSAHELWK